MIGLGIDAGASSTRWLLLDDRGREPAGGTALPITGHIFSERSRRETLERLRALLVEVVTGARPDAVMAGISGLGAGSEAQQLFIHTIADQLGLAQDAVRVENDMYIAYAAAFEPGEGVLLYAGTGSVAYHLRRDGGVVRAGGHGYLIDDVGAGFWIGQQGLRRTMRWADRLGRPAEGPLAAAIYQELGSREWSEILEAVYRGGRRRLAGLAPLVGRAAEEDDDVATGILQEAGTELANLALRVLARLEHPLPVAFAGGISRLSPTLTRALERALPEEVPLQLTSEEPVRAAARLALAGG